MPEKLKAADTPANPPTVESQAKSATVEIHKDEAGNVSIGNPECDKADVLYPGTEHVQPK